MRPTFYQGSLKVREPDGLANALEGLPTSSLSRRPHVRGSPTSQVVSRAWSSTNERRGKSSAAEANDEI